MLRRENDSKQSDEFEATNLLFRSKLSSKSIVRCQRVCSGCSEVVVVKKFSAVVVTRC